MHKVHVIFASIFIVITIPLVILLYQSYSQLQLGTNSLYTGHAMFVANTMNQRLARDLAVEEKRSYSEYGFIRTVQVIGGEENTLSELVDYPITSQYTGLIGHFQLTPDNTLRTPFLPEGRFGQILLEQIPQSERARREEVRNKIKTILDHLHIENHGIEAMAQPRDSVEKVIDHIYKQDLKLDRNKKDESARPYRVETTSEMENIAFNAESQNMDSLATTTVNYNLEVEIEPFMAKINSDYIVFYRNVTRGNELYIQGYIVDTKAYLNSLVKNETQFYPLEKNLVLEFKDDEKTLLSFGNSDATLEIFSTRLVPPLNKVSLVMHMKSRYDSRGGSFLIFLGAVVLIILGGGLVAIYRLTRSELNLAKKRQDFISAVSHELKTPLTSIRMYAELLQNSWVANEQKRQKYYGQIASEADRLTRLIQNVLNLSKLDGDRWNVQLTKDRPKAVLDDFVATYSKNVEKHGFELTVSSDTDVRDITLMMDRDAIMQILMNLVDNSLKFSKDADYKMIVIELRIKDTDVYLAVRDYGPGIPPNEMKKVFQEFYRVENEMTRKTSGTGIGLSMVKKLCSLTNMKIEMENANPGLRTKIHFPPLEI